MPTLISHPAAAVAIRLAGGPRAISRHLVAAAALGSVLPDLDVVGLRLGVPYGSLFGHRGFSHSLTFALLLGLLAALGARWLRSSPAVAFCAVAISTASHGFFDAMTNGGLGVAFFSPFSNHRYFFPWRPIYVSPLSLGGFSPRRILAVGATEMLFVWGPCLLLAGLVLALKARRGAVSSPSSLSATIPADEGTEGQL